MTRAMPWDKWYFEDLDKDCGALSLAARGAWVWIIGDLRNHDGERTLNLEGWARVLRASIPQTIAVLREIISAKVCDSSVRADALPEKTDARIDIRCRRIFREAKIRKQHNLRQQRYSGKRSTDAKNDADLTIERLEAEKQEAETPYNPSDAAPQTDGGNGHRGLSLKNLFEILWESYPALRRTKKDQCLSEFAKLHPNKLILNHALAAIDVLSKSEEWTKESGRYVPGLLKFIQNRTWEAIPVQVECQTCNRIGIIVRKNGDLLPWTIERECEQGLKPEVCPHCRGKNRISAPGLPDLKFG